VIALFGHRTGRVRCQDSPVDAPVSAPSARQADIGWAGAAALTFALLYSLTLAAGGGYVFYASTHPVSLATGYFAMFPDFPWFAADLLILAACWAGPVALLIAGLIHFRRKWRLAVAWVGAVAAGTVISYVIFHDYRLLFTACPCDDSGSPLGPSRWAPGAPYWQAFAATIGQLAVGVVMTALIAASARRDPRREPPEGTTSWLPALPWTTQGDPADATTD